MSIPQAMKLLVPPLAISYVIFSFFPPSIALDSMAEAYASQANHCYKRGETWRAAILYKQAIQEEEKDDNDELYIASLHNNLGECYRRLAKDPGQRSRFELETMGIPGAPIDYLQLAADELVESLRIKELKATATTDYIYIAIGLENLAAVYAAQNRLTESEALYRRVIRIRESKEGKDSNNCASAYLGIGDNLSHGHTHLYHEAEQSYLKALSLYRQSVPSSDPILGVCHQKLATLYYKWNKPSEAGSHYDSAFQLYQKNLPHTLMNLNNLKSELADLPIAVFGQLRTDFENICKEKSPNQAQYLQLLKQLVAAARRLGNPGKEDAIFLSQKLAEIQRQKQGSSNK